VVSRGFDDDFLGGLDRERWLPEYLPHWSTPGASAARYDLDGSGLRLRIDADQPPWRPDLEGMRVSAIQTANVSGPVGSSVGQDPHRDGLVVSTAVPGFRGWTVSEGRIEAVVSASPDPTCMLGIWTLGALDGGAADSGELCIAELFGDRIGPGGSIVRIGVKPHEDPRLRLDVRDVHLPMDATRPHAYAVEWGGGAARILVDGETVGEFDQAPAYPQHLVIALFEFPSTGPRDAAAVPKSATVHRVIGVPARA
jgi:hypothetical protein